MTQSSWVFFSKYVCLLWAWMLNIFLPEPISKDISIYICDHISAEHLKAMLVWLASTTENKFNQKENRSKPKLYSRFRDHHWLRLLFILHLCCNVVVHSVPWWIAATTASSWVWGKRHSSSASPSERSSAAASSWRLWEVKKQCNESTKRYGLIVTCLKWI